MEFTTKIVVKEEPTDDCEVGDVLDIEYKADMEVVHCPLMSTNCPIEDPVLFAKPENRHYLRQIKCNNCNRWFSNKESQCKHNLKHLKVVLDKCPVFECNICPIAFTTSDKLKAHVQEHVGSEKKMSNKKIPVTKQKHQCNICGKLLPYKSWYEHIRYVHSQERVPCTKCGKDFKCLRTLIRHNMYVHEGLVATWKIQNFEPASITCSVCRKMFSNKSALKTHVRNCHSGVKYACYICKSVLKSKSYLLTHMRRVHYYDGKEHTCDTCGKKFKLHRYLKEHKRKSQCSFLDVSIKIEPAIEEQVF